MFGLCSNTDPRKLVVKDEFFAAVCFKGERCAELVFSLQTRKIIYKQHLSSEASGFPLQADNAPSFSSQAK